LLITVSVSLRPPYASPPDEAFNLRATEMPPYGGLIVLQLLPDRELTPLRVAGRLQDIQ
jgi:hypothetical protein